MEEILKRQMQQALDNYCRTYLAATEEDKLTFLMGYQAATNVAKNLKEDSQILFYMCISVGKGIEPIGLGKALLDDYKIIY